MDKATKAVCYHCSLPLVPGHTFQVEVLGEDREVCCPGCQAVAQSIVDNGLEDYYRFRTEPAVKGDELLTETLDKLTAFDAVEIQEEFVIDEGETKQIQLSIEGISCAACAWLIEKQLAKTHGHQTGICQCSITARADYLVQRINFTQSDSSRHRKNRVSRPSLSTRCP